MNENDADDFGGIRPRDPVDESCQRSLDTGAAALLREIERQRAISQLERANAEQSLERRLVVGVENLERAVLELMQLQSPFSADDIELIKAHVRHPGALEAARLRETIHCAHIALQNNAVGTAISILEAAGAKG